MSGKVKVGWEVKKLQDCFKLKSGDALTSKMMGGNGIYPVFGGNGIAGLHNEFNLSGSNVIIGRVGALCGNVRYMNEKIWLTDNAFKIVDFKYELDHSFLTYLLNFKNLREYARQAAQPVISN
nr:restriction endonuclease subunit S [Methylovulum sp.]